MTDDEWSAIIKTELFSKGWTLDKENDEGIWLSKIDGARHWIQDYDKKTRSFICYDGNQKVNVIQAKNEG